MAGQKRRVWRYLAYGGVTLAMLPLLLAGLAFWQKDRLIGLVIAKCNERLTTPVRVDRIDLTIWATFPRLAVEMDSVIIQESVPGHARRMAALGKVRFGFSPLEMLRGHYAVEYLHVEGGYVQMRRLADGSTNYDILRSDSTPPQPGQESGFALKQVRLDSLRYRYVDESPGGAVVAVRLPHGEASLATQGPLTTVSLKTEGAELRKLLVGGHSYADALPVTLDNTLEIESKKEIRFRPATVRLGQADFALSGTVGLGATVGTYRFAIQNEGSSLAALTVLLPASARREMEAYRTQGQVYFKGEVQATQRGSRYPRVEASFGARGARFSHPGYKMAVSGVSLTGRFTLPEGNSLAAGHLILKGAKGVVEGHPFTAELDLQNLEKPRVSGFAKARLPLAFFGPQLANAGITEPAGEMDLDVRFDTDALGHTKAEGSVGLAGIAFLAGSRKLRFEGWQGALALEGEVLRASALSGRIGRSDLALEGRLEHLLGYLSGTRPALGLEVAIQSKYLDLDELLAARTLASAADVAVASKAGESQDYRFVIAPGLHLSADCEVGQMRFRRFSPRAIRGHIAVANQRLSVERMRFYEVGGLFQVSGSLDAAPEMMRVDARYSVDGARMDSLFYVMENFGQKTLQHNQIQGQLSTQGTIALGMNHKLDVQPASVVAAAQIKLVDGALLYFEPAQALGRFIDKDELKYLKFSELSNTFTVQNQVLTIPEMDIRSNVFRCYVRGTHTFSQEMDYHLKVPMKYIRKSSLEAGGAEMGGNLLLAMRGRPGNIKVGYDMGALKDKISSDFKEEKQHFLDIFKRKPKEAKEEPASEDVPVRAKEEEKEPEFMDLD